jgi:hypothetical protein
MAAKHKKHAHGPTVYDRHMLETRRERRRAKWRRQQGQQWMEHVARHVRLMAETRPDYRALIREDDLATAAAFYQYARDLWEQAQDPEDGAKRMFTMLEEVNVSGRKEVCDAV